jgi:predicted MFS family arabinose efflux permease
MKTAFTGYQKFVVSVLAFLQFTIILDFMILSPLGAILMPAFKITPSQFGLVVSAYAFSAGGAGLLAAGFADRFDRKKLLLFFYCGFILGTLFCALAPTYEALLAARMLTGLFGGVIGSIVFAITTDLFPMEMRGRVMGVIQTSFAASQILGIPLGLYLSNLWGWHAPFLMIVVAGVAAGIVIWLKLKPVDGHLELKSDRNAFAHLFKTVSNPTYLFAFATMALLATGGFMLMPFSSAFSVNNIGITLEQLPMVYMITGVSAIFAGPMLGRLSDAVGKFPVFVFGSVLSVAMVLIYTHLGITPIHWVVLVNVFLFVGISARMISATALLSAIPGPADRGSFMSVNSSLQQISGGIAAAVGGMIVVEGAGGKLEHFDHLGFVVIGAMVIMLGMMVVVNRIVQAKLKAAGGMAPIPTVAQPVAE